MSNGNPNIAEYGKKTRYKKGQSGNPLGRGIMPKELRGIDRITQREVELIVSRMLRMELQALKKLIKDPKEKVINVMFAAAMLKAIQQGDTKKISDLLDRIVGKVITQVEVGVQEKIQMKDMVSIIPDEKLIELAQDAVKHESSNT